jgi:YesN/AraC family two-component response regulator
MEPLPYDISGVVLLYVEDEADARGMVSKMLVLNYPKLKLHTAENGAAGLELYREHRPDVVMTDINMPVMDGIRMSREIKLINPEALIIAVTAHSDTSYLLNAIEIGIHHYVLKPINYDELFSVLDKILEQIVLKRLVGDQNRRISESERQLAVAQGIALAMGSRRGRHELVGRAVPHLRPGAASHPRVLPGLPGKGPPRGS